MAPYQPNAALYSTAFRDPEFIAFFGALTRQNILDYFSRSPFYDLQSTNQVLRMQNIAITGGFMSALAGDQKEEEDLKRFTGIEFVVVHAQPDALFVIHKRRRLSPAATIPLAAYYVLDGTIYQAPDMHSVLGSKMLTSVTALRATIDAFREAEPPFSIRRGYQWTLKPPEETDDDDDEEEDADDRNEIEDAGGVERRDSNTLAISESDIAMDEIDTT
ncbi:Mediator of RNA polymerase II transcription subunit 6 [Tilletia horrida]|uniref:Mediator of RNA polymerase II transcription subunit 6 n=1 Tax=Tilletia horrida TaxID=155126 RepID=A0AAN6JMK6_9BASI|nr:Mediator of RNA polymerase II transcription subunit 6 [Tilletia horrida]KAK0538070.1 Mediator of RNA polymerase II transcription subunit 6 [Tilletia horrida]KAK0538739.1 Mediator of RNA polymerase II transcription subunit 6 [Tilletia horrida]KAK0561677.1 Mediator of RNA polymerase II transcription subunit 6 [Tilletia horrida]